MYILLLALYWSSISQKNMYKGNYNDVSVFYCSACETWKVPLVIVESLQVQTWLGNSKNKHSNWCCDQ